MAKIKHWGEAPFFRMSHEFELEKMSAAAILVMVSLSKHMNSETYESYVSYETLVKETHRSNTTISKALRELREMGYVGKKRRFNNSNVYALVVPSHLAKPPSPTVATHQSDRGGRSIRQTVETNNKPNIRNLDTRSFAERFPVDPNAPVDDYYG